MEYQTILESLGRWLDWLVQHLNASASDLALALLLLPILLAFLSRQLVAILGTALLAIVAVVARLIPEQIGSIIVLSGFVGSFILALHGVLSWREHRALQIQLAQLREEVLRLQVAEDRRFLGNLQSRRSVHEPIGSGSVQDQSAHDRPV